MVYCRNLLSICRQKIIITAIDSMINLQQKGGRKAANPITLFHQDTKRSLLPKYAYQDGNFLLQEENMKLRNCLVVSLCLLTLSGCSSISLGTSAAASAVSENTSVAKTSADTQAAAETDQETTAAAVQSENEMPSQSSIDLKSLTDLVGKSDSQVTAVLGQGEEMKNGEGLILDRTYTLPLMGENANVTLTFNLYQEGSDILEQAVINLGQSDIEDYAETLTQLFGEPTETYEKSYFFVSDNKTLVLADPYGDGASIEISLGEIE